MNTKSKPTAKAERQRALKTCHGGAARQKHYPIKTAENQPVPIPGTALTAFLKRYRDELHDCEPTREVNQLMDCVLVLLDAVERGRR